MQSAQHVTWVTLQQTVNHKLTSGSHTALGNVSGKLLTSQNTLPLLGLHFNLGIPTHCSNNKPEHTATVGALL
jgi:hypothetical protein